MLDFNSGILDAQGIYNLPEDMYYVPEHASVYNGNTPVAQNVQAIRYDEENKVWQYRRLCSFGRPWYASRTGAPDVWFFGLPS